MAAVSHVKQYSSRPLLSKGFGLRALRNVWINDRWTIHIPHFETAEHEAMEVMVKLFEIFCSDLVAANRQTKGLVSILVLAEAVLSIVMGRMSVTLYSRRLVFPIVVPPLMRRYLQT